MPHALVHGVFHCAQSPSTSYLWQHIVALLVFFWEGVLLFNCLKAIAHVY
ncbi:hypothetical protein [aff. Roholtiella sp. LEGE 12411]|nr:hypothetical protein [aff. Roholtiella sp. LEGE 12411]